MSNFNEWAKKEYGLVDGGSLEDYFTFEDVKPKWVVEYLSDAYDAGFKHGQQSGTQETKDD